MDIALFFFSLTSNIKLFHWQTKSYAGHIASDTLYTTLQPLIDRFMEVLQGKVGRRINAKGSLQIQVDQLRTNTEFEAYLRVIILKLSNESLQDMLGYPSSLENQSDLLNIRDEIVANLNQTCYLLSFN